MTSRRPNILMVVSDQEQAVEVVPDQVHRPGLESLLDRGTHFAGHHVVALPCGPSRSVLYTGLHTEHTGVHGNPGVGRDQGMSASIPTIGTMLRERGYHTAYKGKWHVSALEPVSPFLTSAARALEPFGFSDYSPDGDPVGVGWEGFKNDPAIAAEAAAWLHGDTGSKPDDRPWFLAVNFVNPHDVMFFDATGAMNDGGGLGAPRLPVPRATPYDRVWDVDLPESFDAEHHGPRPEAHSAIMRRVEALLGVIPHDDREAWLRLRHYYLSCLLDLDRHVDTVLRALASSGHADDTVVIYTTDHGEAAGAHGMREKPVSVYREAINVPLVVAHPEGSRREVTAPTSSLDVVPTVLSLAGVDAATRAERYPHLRGHDLANAVSGSPSLSREGALVCMRAPTGSGRQPDPSARTSLHGLVHDGWKLARYCTSTDFTLSGGRPVLGDHVDLELFDTANDPHELDNLVEHPEHAGRLADMASRLEAIIRDEVESVEVPVT